ncbi:hypothetical protein [Nesterenkonia aerolata]|uniref:Uncharacterized protein n=1 Tax=Nesterenkonia aerolata TaxID=3074079 RepID=A0ABU2DNV4_9MICC|nr:hypothetical protein [Nesterenkonia sp. LY-0111]MDR8018198.1 hypothetical protein [Nesterenkonia sp. LY-0111]
MTHLHTHEHLNASGEPEERLPDEVPRDDLDHLRGNRVKHQEERR